MGSSGRGQDIRKVGRRVKICWKYSLHMYVNGKMRPVKPIPGIGGGEIRRMMEEG
jgi:hypothetical protein